MTASLYATLLIGTALLLTGCERPMIDSPSLPTQRTITDQSGRTLNVTITSRELNSITFTRASDGQKFTLDISKLSEEDREFARRLPISYSKPPEFTENRTVNKTIEEPGALKFLRAELEEKQSEREMLYEELATTTPGSIADRTKKSNIRRIEKEIGELESEIRTLELSAP